MSQKTNLNVSPYFDDYNPDKNFYRILFKPGFPVQSRELTTLQSILQNQIELFGSHFFKDGAVVIPGNATYDGDYQAVKINDTHLGLNVGFYLNELVGKRIQGQTSQLIAVVKKVITKFESSTQNYTLYVKYINSDLNFEVSQFRDGETLITLDTFKYGNTTINSGETISSLLSSNATAVGSAVSISNGVYFIRGTFVSVKEDTLILDQYTNSPSYRVGLSIQETTEFASSQNSDLFDNARGFANFSAPGADRLKISTFLTKKSLSDFDDKDFIEILRISNGVVKKTQNNDVYSSLKEYIAKRSYEESGDYAVSPFNVLVENSLNDRVSSEGVYFQGQRTEENNIPSENLLAIKVSPGKAYVKGFDIEKSDSTILDVEKPRDKQTILSASVPFEMGNLLKVNNVTGTPVIGIDNNYTISLYDQRKSSNTLPSGNEIGKARVYSFCSDNTPYLNSSSQWNLYLFDVQTYTELTLNQSLNSTQCPSSSYIKGLSSGASGYVVSDATSSLIKLTQTSGSFSPGEQVSINGLIDVSRSIVSIKNYSTNDIKSVYQNSSTIGLSANFIADTVLIRKTLPNFSSNDLLSISSSGIATCAGRNFVGVTEGTIIRYQRQGLDTETYNRVSQISSDGLSITLSAVPSVSGVCNGELPSLPPTSSPTNTTATFNITVTPSGGSALSAGQAAPASMVGTNPTASGGEDYSSINAQNINPSVAWTLTGLPAGVTVSSYEVHLEDLSNLENSKPTLHWFISNIPNSVTNIPANATVNNLSGATINNNYLGNTAVSGVNVVGYSGPQPPSGTVHTYRLTVVARLTGNSTTSVLKKTLDFIFNPTGTTVAPNSSAATHSNNVTVSVPASLTATTINTTFSAGYPTIQNEDRAYLYAKLNHKNISDINFTKSELKVSRQVSNKSTNNVGTLSLSLSDVGISSAFFDNFNTQKYSVFYQDGSAERLTSDKFSLDGTGNSVTLTGLSPSKSNIVVNATVRKNSITNKQKIYIRSQKLEINKTKIGVFNSVSGLMTSLYYGTRIEDEEISLNVSDVANVISVYESVNNASPILDSLTFNTGLNLNSSSILGEKIVGESSGAVGQIVTRNSSSTIEFIYLNSNKFINGETITFSESNIRSSLVSVNTGLYIDRTSEYVLDRGQREQYYDYSRIVRKNSSIVPSRKLLVIFNYYEVPTNDNGDVYTANSYPQENYEKDIPTVSSNTRCTDILDFRPRVSPFNSSSSSPFDFSSRNFSTSGNNPSLVVAPNDSSILGYSYYLPRIDKLVLNKSGDFNIIKGVSSDNPKEPSSIEDSMDIAVIHMPPYLYNPDDATVRLINNKRYTMKDIANLEKRLENVEVTSSLSLLELNTKSLQIQDSDGIDRFKSGFFADNFKSNNFIDIKDLDSKCTINTETEELVGDISSYSLKSEIGVSGNVNINDADFSTDLSLLDINVRKTGDLVTLNYNEVEWQDLNQNFATKEQNINPFSVSNYNGYVKLTPSSDTWVRSINYENGIVVRTQGEWENSLINNLISSSSSNKSNKFKSKNIQFYATGLRPFTQYYSFFDSNSNIDIIPKLLKIKMTSGSFQVGEIVDGYFSGVKVASFRLSSPNHKNGAYNNPSETFTENPYNSSLTLSAYSSSSIVLNIDTYSLSDDASGRFFGYIPPGTVLIGKTTNSQAVSESQSLITDSVGDLIGCFFIRNPFETPSPVTSFTVSPKTFKLSSSSNNSSTTNVSFAQNTFYPNGIINSSIYTQSLSIRRSSPLIPLGLKKTDPLSQTFRTDNIGGFLSSIDLYFAGKDKSEKIFVEIRETEIGGVPSSNLVQNYARVELLPSNINTSSNGQIATRIKFPSPIYLEPNKQYALCLMCPSSNNYRVWIAESNQATVETQSLPNVQQVIYSNNYSGGNLYKPQNGSSWNSSISEDLKFKFYKCNFTSNSGTVYFHNPNLSIGSTTYVDDANIPKLINNPIKTLPRKLVVGITTSSNLNSILTKGTKVGTGTAYGYIENVGGNISGISTSNEGSGYSDGTFIGVPLYSITGYGYSATADIRIIDNKISSVSIANSGSGYLVGDVLGITTSSVIRGSGARITVSNTQNIDTLYLTNVQGEGFYLNQSLIYYNESSSVSMASTVVRIPSYIPNDLYSGNIFEVNQYNHGMHADNNIVVITGVIPNTAPESLTANIDSNSLTISVANTSNFISFENNPVSANNLGYVIVNNEIISYNAVGTQSLVVSRRGVNESPIKNHSIGDLVYKYELNGVSLTRINTSHTLPSNKSIKSFRDIDKYHIEFNRSDRNSGNKQLSFIDEKNLGGSNVKASQNIQFSSIIPYFNVLKPERTTVSSIIRTISGTSVNGNETSFLDQGYQPVTLNSVNYFNTPRLVSSRVNETSKLASLTNNKSLTLGITFSTSDSNFSPVVDVSEAATFVLNRNRINYPVKDYSFDSRSNSPNGDPHSSVYISKKITLKQPASSLKVIVSAYRHSTSDFRILYKLFKADSSEITQSYQLFPGYNNLSDRNGDGVGETVINVSLNDGSSDIFVRPSAENEFLEYQFTANDIGEFTGFAIKIVMNGTNEAYTPRFKDLRAIALS